VNIEQLNKAFESRVRLGIMALLMVEDSVEYNILKSALDLTDGNLASHLKALEKETYVEVRKSFLGRKPNTRYAVTELGKKAFNEHLQALENLLKSMK
jgi:DNA-binding MarR family transcriptional regulator